MMLKKTILLFSFLLYSFLIQAQKQISVPKLKAHIKYLSSSKLKGRLAGSQQELTAANYIAKNFKNLGLIPKGNISSYFYSFKYNPPRFLGDSIGGKSISSINVVGFLDNHCSKTIVICAHYDGLGMNKDSIFYGADDNASGVAGLLELARMFCLNKKSKKFNILFICFSANEKGFFGSKAFVEHPTIDLKNVKYVINLERIGRLDEKKEIEIIGKETLVEFDSIFIDLQSNLKPIFLDLNKNFDSYYFNTINIPAITFSSGTNADTHTVKDEDKKINFDGEKLILDYVFQFIEKSEKLSVFK